MAPVKRLLGFLALAAALSLLVACGGEPTSAPAPSGTPSSGGTAAGEPTSEASDEPSLEPSVEPATGPVLRQDHVSVTSPEGFTVTPEADRRSGQTQTGEGTTIFLSELPDLAPGLTLSTRELAEVTLENSFYLRKPRIVAPVQAGGVEWFHLAGPIDSGNYVDAFGTVTDGVQLDLVIETYRSLPAAERRAIVASTLASVELR